MDLTLRDDQVASLGKLYVAAWKGSRDDVVKLVNDGCAVDGTVNKKSPMYCTPLHLAVMSPNKARGKVKFLLSKGADVNARDFNNATALHRAVSCGDTAVPVIKDLLGNGIDFKSINSDGDTAHDLAVKANHQAIIELFRLNNKSRALLLRAAAKYRNFALVQELVEKEAQKKRSKDALIITKQQNELSKAAVRGGDEEILNYLVEKGLDVNKATPITILKAAVLCGDTTLFTFLGNLGWTFPKITDKTGASIMSLAVHMASVDMIEFLLQNGFRLKYKDNQVERQLQDIARRRKDQQVVDCLVNHGMDMVDTASQNSGGVPDHVLEHFNENGIAESCARAGITLVDGALREGREDLIEYLDEQHLLVTLMQGREHSLLRDAVRTNQLKMFKDLVGKDLDLDAVNMFGSTLLHTAAELRSEEFIVYLLDEGADISATNHEGKTVLHLMENWMADDPDDIVYQETMLQTFRCLLDHGADVIIDQKHEGGWSVLHFAAFNWNDALVNLLLERGANANTQSDQKESPLSVAINGDDPVEGEPSTYVDQRVCSEEFANTLFALLSHGARWNKDLTHRFNTWKEKSSDKKAEKFSSSSNDDDDCSEDSDDDNGGNDQREGNVTDGTNGEVESDGEDDSVASQDSLYSRLSMSSDDYYRQALLQNDQAVEDDGNYVPDYDEQDVYQWAEQDPLVIRALIFCIKAWLRERALGDSLTPIPWNVIEGGPRAVEELYAKLGKSIPERVKYHHRVCVLGSTGSGKTTLIESLKSSWPELHHQDKRPVGIRIVPIGTRDDHRIAFWDIAGLDIFEPAVPGFFTEETLYLICVDLKAYSSKMKAVESDLQELKDAKMKRFVSEKIFKWIRLIITRHPKANFLIVGTKGDRVSPEKKQLIQRDFKTHLVDKLREELYDSRDGQVHGEGPTTHTGTVFSYGINVSCNYKDDVKDARKQILEAIKNSDGVPFGPKHASVMDAIKRRVKDTGSSVDKTESVNILCAKLVMTIDDMTLKQCRRCLDDLQAVGKVWYLQDTRSTTVFLDPAIIPQGLCSLVQRVKSSDVCSESVIDELSFWGDLSSHDRLQLRRALQHLRLAYPATTAKNPALIVPACWKHREITLKAHLIQQHSLLARHDVEGKAVVCWEYEVSVEVSARVFVHFACTCKGLEKRTNVHRDYFQDTATGDVVVVASLTHHGDSVMDVIRIEVAAKEASVGWRRMVLYVMAMDKALRQFPGLPASQFIVHSKSEKERRISQVKNERYELQHVTTKLEREIESGRWIDRVAEPWMPPKWWLFDWKDEEKAYQWLQQQDMHGDTLKAVNTVRKLVIADPTLRQFPALWTLAYIKDSKDKRRLEVRMLSDYSGECCHQEKPIVIRVDRGCEFLVKHEGKIQLGLSILSTVVPTFIPEGVLEKIAETAFEVLKPGVADGIDKAKIVISTIQDLGLSPGSQFTSADKTLTHGETTLLLRDLLLLHDANFHPLMIHKLSGLESAVNKDGRFVWASRKEIDASKGDLEPCYPASVGKTLIKLELKILSVTGLDDTKDTYCEWQLLNALTPATCVLEGVTSQPTDTTDPRPSDPFRLYYIQSEDELSTYHLRLQIKKKSSPWRQRVLQCSTRLVAWSTSVLGEGVDENLAMGAFWIEIKNPKTTLSIAKVQYLIS